MASRARKPSRKTARPRTSARKTSTGKTSARRVKKNAGAGTFRIGAFEPTFTVDDVARSERFYTGVLGFVVDQRWSEGGQLQGLLLKAGNSRLGLSQDDWSKGRDRKKGVGFSLWCKSPQDIDALAARIKGAGGRLSIEPNDEPGLGRSLAVDDPDGFRLRFYRRG
jgi:catechol 2,3-dioxygenase-like lactoylglutathione lyase family enzyme